MPEIRKLILKNFLSPGDLVMLTAAVRDLHRCYPKRYLTDVRTPCPHLWENNPYITALKEPVLAKKSEDRNQKTRKTEILRQAQNDKQRKTESGKQLTEDSGLQTADCRPVADEVIDLSLADFISV